MTKNAFMWSFILLVLTIGSSQDIEDQEYTFDDFCRQFNKNYDAQEYAHRQPIFLQNYALIQQLQAEGNGNCHFTVNNMTDWTREEVQALTQYANPLNSGRPLSTYRSPLRSSGSLSYPASLDYRVLGKVSDVKNQGSCGSCWAFSTTAQYESLLLIETGTEYDLAQQYVLDCTSSGSCGGGYPIDAIDVIVQSGIPLQSSYAYAGYDDAYGSTICSASNKIMLSGIVTNTQHYGSVTSDQLKEILYQHGPVSIGLYADNGFSYYSSGIYSGCPSNSQYYINHAVLLVGYTQQGHWIIKNSWGTNWGNDGYITIHKDSDCGLTSYVDVIEANINSNDDGSDEESSDDNTDPEPDPAKYISYTVTMTDSGGDGWHGITIGVKQDGAIVSTFGSSFLSGSSSGPITINVKENAKASLVVTQIASWTQEIGFTVSSNTGDVVYSRCSGTAFTSDAIFTAWCPGPDACSEVQQLDITVQMTDSWGDGWNGNVIGLRQAGSIVGSFGSAFSTGHNYGPTTITVPTGISTDVVVHTMGSWRSQVGFIIFDGEGNIILERSSGYDFASTTIFGTFTLGTLGSRNVRVADIADSDAEKPVTNSLDIHYVAKQSTKGQTSEQISQSSNTPNSTTDISGLIAGISILGFFTLFFMITSIGLFFLWNKERSYLKYRMIDHQNNATEINSITNAMINGERVSQGESQHVVEVEDKK